MKPVIRGSVTSSNNSPKNAVWVKDGQDMKWKIFKGTNEDSVDSDFLSRVSRKNNANYIDVIVVPNGTHPNEVINSSSTRSKNATFKNDNRLSPTSERYKGYLIVLDRGGEGYNVYDKHRELEDAGYPSKEAAKRFIDELVDNGNDCINSAYEYGVSDWTELASKSVEDSDGFNTDYTLYTNGETYICMFGDKDIYEPDASYADYETESEQDAWDWFNSYTGFADEEGYDDLMFIDNRKSSIINNDPSLDPGFDEYDVYGSEDLESDFNDKLATLYDRACATFGEDLVNKIIVECGGPTPEENPDYWWTDSLDTEKFYHRLTELFLNKMLNY